MPPLQLPCSPAPRLPRSSAPLLPCSPAPKAPKAPKAPLRTRLPGALALLLALLGGGARGGEPAPAPAPMLEDARLLAVTFIDPDRGWAVGDRGVIWRTADGGRSWRRQPSGVTATLRSIQFVDSRHGWIVGGWVQPYTHFSTAVVLRTLDGGENWERVPGLILPQLRRVRFFDARQGVAIGDASALFPAGLFRSTDGGKTWTPLPAASPQQWTAGDFVDLERGAVAGPQGQLGMVAYGNTSASRTPEVGPRMLRDLELRALRGWLVGDGGLVMRSDDGGASWRFPDGPLPDGAADYCDFRAIATYGEHTWVAGAPGSLILHSPDGGRSWQRLATNSPVPLDDVVFLDERRGWAVGALGTILSTRDGGRSWRPARGSQRRLALLGLFSSADSAPWELLAQACASEGYLGAVEQVVRHEPPVFDPTRAPYEDRLVAAVGAAGGSAAQVAWNFPGMPPGLNLPPAAIAARWDAMNDGRGADQMRELLVRRIRQWRPDVLVTESTDVTGSRGVGRELAQLVVEAAQRAGDPTAFPDHAALVSLSPWRVSKVYALTTPSSSAAVRLNTFQLATNLRAALRDYAAPARGLVQSDASSSVPQQIGLRLLVNRLPQDVGRADIFGGLNLPPGCDARRLPLDLPLDDLESLSRITQQRQNVEQLITRAGDEGAAWLGQLDDLTRDLPSATGGSVLYQLAQRYHRQGQGELAADVLERLVHSYPDHDLADAALLWLVQYHASSEVGWRLAHTTHFQSQVAAAQFDPAKIETIRPEDVSQVVPAGGPVLVKSGATAAASWDQHSRAPRVLELAEHALRTRPALHAEPALRFPLAVSQRALGFGREVEHYFHQTSAVAVSSAWQQAALGELWLRHATGTAPKPIIACGRAGERPNLDGKLDEPLWEATAPMPLRGADGKDRGWPTEVRLAYDDQFLYIAARCTRAPQCEYPQSDEPRPRDPDLADRDRIELLIDVDRDYATYYRLVVDHRGWPADACWGDATWDPRWFVAQAEDAQSWSIEAAIPWTELAPAPPLAGTAWAVGVQRVAPQAGLIAWTWPSAVVPRPEGFGLLVFQ